MGLSTAQSATILNMCGAGRVNVSSLPDTLIVVLHVGNEKSMVFRTAIIITFGRLCVPLLIRGAVVLRVSHPWCGR